MLFHGDAAAKVTGTAKYAYDQQPAGMTAGKILRSPRQRIVSIDTDKASRTPGVKAVLKVPDISEDKSARYAGVIAAVAAETEAQAEAALRAIEVEYDINHTASHRGFPRGCPGWDAEVSRMLPYQPAVWAPGRR